MTPNTIKSEETKITAETKNVSAELGNGNLLSEDNKILSLPLKYWIPTLVSVVVGTTLFIWFLFTGILSPIKAEILEIKTKGIASDRNSPIIVNTLFLESTNGILMPTWGRY